jgi:hypothetical protein
VRYYRVAAGFPTKPSWLKAIKNKQYVSWSGLTWQAANKHYPKSEATLKGHGQKTKSRLRSMKTTTESETDDNDGENTTQCTSLDQPSNKKKQ